MTETNTGRNQPGPQGIATERRVPTPEGTRDRFAEEKRRLDGFEHVLLSEFANSGYQPVSTPVLEFTELHERKSGAAIVSRLMELSEEREGRLCLRPELTAGVVRAYASLQTSLPELPWRVSVAGPVFRSGPLGPGIDRQFSQVGVELLGAPGPVADAEIIALADRSVQALGFSPPKVRIGHVGLILEMLEHSGLPRAAQSSLIEVLSQAASDGRDLSALDHLLDRLSKWLDSETREHPGPEGTLRYGPSSEIARLFDHLVPDVAGRRTGPEIMERIYRKWETGRSLRDSLAKIQDQAQVLSQLRGPAIDVLTKLEEHYGGNTPGPVGELKLLIELLEESGTAPDRIELDLGFSRGIGFYSQMVFELSLPTSDGLIEICGGGRYDGLARILGSTQDDRGVGFAFGLERLDQVLVQQEPTTSNLRAPSGCLVLAIKDFIVDAARLLNDLRHVHKGAWEDSGPLVGPELIEDSEDLSTIKKAQDLAKQRGFSALIVVCGRLSDPQKVHWFRLVETAWAELPAAPSILIAGSEVTGGRVEA